MLGALTQALGLVVRSVDALVVKLQDLALHVLLLHVHDRFVLCPLHSDLEHFLGHVFLNGVVPFSDCLINHFLDVFELLLAGLVLKVDVLDLSLDGPFVGLALVVELHSVQLFLHVHVMVVAGLSPVPVHPFFVHLLLKGRRFLGQFDSFLEA